MFLIIIIIIDSSVLLLIVLSCIYIYIYMLLLLIIIDSSVLLLIVLLNLCRGRRVPTGQAPMYIQTHKNKKKHTKNRKSRLNQSLKFQVRSTPGLHSKIPA